MSQEVPEWLQLAADGKLPVDEPVSTGWGNSAFAFGANKLVEENVEAAAPATENGHAAEQNGDTKPAKLVEENGVNGTASASPSPAAAEASQEQPPPPPKQEAPKSTGFAAAAVSENDDW